MSKDYILGGLAGFLTGICLIPVAINSGYDQASVLAFLPLLTTVGIAFGVWLGRFLSIYLAVMYQVGKFAAVGILNTAINFAVINIFSLMSGVTAGLSVGEYNIPATAVAATNSYFWNKFWVFQGSNQSAQKDVPKFITVTIIALIVRSTLLTLITTYVPHGNIGGGAWLNIANVIATFAGILVDFLGYKFIVFKRDKVNEK
jgi:putative flippase GtrA